MPICNPGNTSHVLVPICHLAHALHAMVFLNLSASSLLLTCNFFALPGSPSSARDPGSPSSWGSLSFWMPRLPAPTSPLSSEDSQPWRMGPRDPAVGSGIVLCLAASRASVHRMPAVSTNNQNVSRARQMSFGRTDGPWLRTACFLIIACYIQSYFLNRDAGNSKQ